MARGDGAEIAASACLWIAGLAASAEVVVGGGYASIGCVVARVGGASDAVVANGRRASLASVGAAGLCAITE